MVLLITTTRILSALEAIPVSLRKDLDLPHPSLDTPISHAQVIRLAQHFRHGPPDKEMTLNSLLRGTKVYVAPPPPKPAPSPEYLALKARLLAATEADAYNRMTLPGAHAPHGPSPVFATSIPMLSAINDTAVDETTEILTPSLVLNIFLSVLLTGFSVYWALTSIATPELLISSIASLWRGSRSSPAGQTGSRGASEPVRVLLSLFAALGVGVAEVLIYAIYWKKVADARVKEKKVRERKEVLESDVLGAGGSETKEDGLEKTRSVTIGGEKEEIWGRGPNGGLRRRVRERWEEEKGQDEHKQEQGDGKHGE
ncbi:hypothetical protein FE257_003214 [Aspergillus nanangensis]|uniref:Endoplasmic reticulum-based factor for assembly of V-ATPase-domain-containing protein n=1 Tax=Aspergillus nanangensis TaxID=2582783 RepID=A0AAD4GXM6_ASPNN|nr:hypothetical protein FE257_003214 [Aspergillus nanangensis]